MAKDRAYERIHLVGGPGDGMRLDLAEGMSDLIRWKPITSEERTVAGTFAPVGEVDTLQFLYRRSLRTRSKFVFQP